MRYITNRQVVTMKANVQVDLRNDLAGTIFARILRALGWLSHGCSEAGERLAMSSLLVPTPAFARVKSPRSRSRT
jgi:hypothetical protein